MMATVHTNGLTPAQAFAEITRRRINLTHALGVWSASVELKGEGHNRNRNLRIIDASASTPTGAVAALVNKLDSMPRETALFQEDAPW